MKQRLYIAAILVGAVVATGLGQHLWPSPWTISTGLYSLLIAVLICVALVFPLKISPQASASLASAPILLGVLLLPPIYAAGATALSSFVASKVLKRRSEVATFNMGVAGLAVAAVSILYRWLSFGDTSLLDPPSVAAASWAGLALNIINLSAVAGMVSIQKGVSYWGIWRRTWMLDATQEAGALVLGYLGAILMNDAWWSILLLSVPLTLAYVAFRQSVQVARENIQLAEQLKGQIEQLQTMEAQLVQSAKMSAVGTLAAGIAHEINNPLFVIMGRVELLMRHMDHNPENARMHESLTVISEMAQRASKIVQELRAFSRPDTKMESTRVADLMDAALGMTGKEIASHGIEIMKEYSQVPPVMALPTSLQQVFVNLLQNARDAMPKGGTIALRCWVEDGSVSASVKDTGTGIPKALQPRLFEPFFTTKDVGKGTGLGLYLCHRIVTELKGSITIDSQEGKGTEVIVRLPVHKAEATVAAGGR